MALEKRDTRLTRSDWVHAALRVMVDGVDAVSVEGLAKTLGTTKGSFYWHFADRTALIEAALQAWEDIATTAVIDRLNPIVDPRLRLRKLFEHSFGGADTDVDAALLARVDDPNVGPVVRRVTGARLAFVEHAYRQMGLPRVRAARQARIAYAAYVGHLQIRRATPDDPVISNVSPAYLRQLLATLVPRKTSSDG